MGTKVQFKNCLPGYYSMRDLNEDSSSSSWPLFYGDNTVTNGQYFNAFTPRTTIDDHPGYEKDALKRKMLEHETVFRNQVHELHRLYRIQRDMMEEVKRKELHQRVSIEPSSSSSLRGSQKPSEDARKWHIGGFPMTNSAYGRATILGVEVTNSPMSCTIGNDTQPSQFPFKNGSSSKDHEGLDSRPLKVRKKLFDLHLPAEEYAYVDTEEGGIFEDNSTTSPKSTVKFVLDDQTGVKVPINASASYCRLRSSIGLADLNEPFQYEESMAPSHFDFHGYHSTNGDTKRMNQPAKSSARYLGADHEGFLLNSSFESKVNVRDRLSFYEAGYNKSNLNSVSQALRQDKFPMLNQVNHPPGLYPSLCGRQDLWRNNPHHGADLSEKSRDLSHTFFSSPSFTSSRTHSASSLVKSKNGFAQKLTTFEPPFHSAGAVDRSLQPFSQTQDEPFFGGKWRVDASSRLVSGLESEGKIVNGFYHGSASGSKETQALLRSAGFDHLKYSKDDKLSDRSTKHGFGTFAKRESCHEDSKRLLDINLNEVVASSPNELVIVENLNMTHGKINPEYQMSALPWLRPKPANGYKTCSNYVPDSSSQLCRSRETVGDLNQPVTATAAWSPSDGRVIEKNLNADTQNVKKILGFPIFATISPKEEPISHVSATSTVVNDASEKKIVSTKKGNRVIDINVECDPDEQIADEEQTVEKPTKNTCYIDLNSCVSDCEDPPVPSFESKNNSIKVTLEIDLEAPVFLESEDDGEAEKNVPEDVSFPVSENIAEPIHNEDLQNAADAMLAISSYCPRVNISEDSLAESLHWFANAMSSCAIELEHVSGKESRAGVAFPQQEFSKETDEFEAITLQLVETKKEDYVPKLFVPEVPTEEVEGTSNMLATRSRRGHSRRGRQRKDFQRDILPGLTSLSRRELTEDLQTFGGIMKATGHQWNSGLTRRNGTRNGGGARGRRRVVVETVATTIPSTVCAPSVPQENDIESGLEDRSLTGWGKTTRRPRRQRFPAGNTPAVAST